MSDRFPSLSVAASLVLAAVSAAQGAPPSPVLSVDTHFPAVGSSVTFTIESVEGALWDLEASAAPFELPLGSLGTLFLDPLQMVRVGSGLVPAGGSVAVPVALPANPSLAGKIVYVQAAVATLAGIRLSGSLALRFETVAPSGARVPSSIAVTPDGTRAFVAHRDDGSVSVIDAAADALLLDVPCGPGARRLPLNPVHVAIDPDGRHAFVLSAAAEAISVLDAASGSVAAQLPVPKGCRRIAFDFARAVPTLYVTNDVVDAVLVLTEPSPGVFVAQPPLSVAGTNPNAIVVLPGGDLVVGNLGTHELVRIDPGAGTVLLRATLARLPYDLALAGQVLAVASLTFTPAGPADGENHVLAVRPSDLAVLSEELEDLGTDYFDVAAAGSLVAVAGAGSGTAVLAAASDLSPVDVVDLAPGGPIATPQGVAFVVPNGASEPSKLYAVDYFRETVRAVDVSGAPPFAAGVEIPLAHSGAPRVPGVDLTIEEEGDRFFRSVAFFNGTAQTPNPVTCLTCHPGVGADGLGHARNTPPLFLPDDTEPLGWSGNVSTLSAFIGSAFFVHGELGGAIPPGAAGAMRTFLASAADPPPSPFLAADGALTPEQQAGRALFEGAAGCSACHAAPLFVPPAPSQPTIAAGVGTGLAPANVPSLRGVWATEPYLHDGSAPTLLDILLLDTQDQHGTTSPLTPSEREALVAYLLTL